MIFLQFIFSLLAYITASNDLLDIMWHIKRAWSEMFSSSGSSLNSDILLHDTTTYYISSLHDFMNQIQAFYFFLIHSSGGKKISISQETV